MEYQLKKRISFHLRILIIFLISFCTSGEEIEVKLNTEDKSYWNELSSYLAGIPLEENNRFLPLTNLNYYQAYARSMDNAWNKINNNYIYQLFDA